MMKGTVYFVMRSRRQDWTGAGVKEKKAGGLIHEDIGKKRDNTSFFPLEERKDSATDTAVEIYSHAWRYTVFYHVSANDFSPSFLCSNAFYLYV